MPEVKLEEDITPMLGALEEVLGDMEPGFKEVGQFMTSSIKTSMREQRGLGNRKAYRAVGAYYADRKKRAGGNPERVLYGPSPGKDKVTPTGRKSRAKLNVVARTRGGELAASWRVIKATKDTVYVGAAGTDGAGSANADKAQGHNDRLDIAWNDKLLEKASNKFLNSVEKRVAKRAPKRVE